MIALNVFPKKSMHGSVAVGTFHSLENHRNLVLWQSLHNTEFSGFRRGAFLEKLVLPFAADGHNVLI